MVCLNFGEICTGQVPADGIGNDEIPIRQTLHQGAGTQPVGTMISEIALAHGVEAGNRGHQLIIDPEPTHREGDASNRAGVGTIRPHERDFGIDREWRRLAKEKASSGRISPRRIRRGRVSMSAISDRSPGEPAKASDLMIEALET